MNALPPLDLGPDGRTLTISSTQLDTFKACPQMWAWTYLHRREPATDATSLVAGGAFDEALNQRYRNVKEDVVDAGGNVEQMMLGCIENAYAGHDLPLDEYRTPALFKEAVRRYNEYWQQEPFEVLAVQEVLEAELGTIDVSQIGTAKLVQPIYDGFVRVLLHGIIDLDIRWSEGDRHVMDTKTMNDWSDRKQIEFENSSQAKAYVFLKRAAGVDCHGFSLNAAVIRKPYRDGRQPTVRDLPRFEFHRLRIPISAERIEEWRRDTLAWVETMLRYYAAGRFPMSERLCSNHYGRKCGFLDVCTAPSEQRALVLSTDMYRDYKTADAFQRDIRQTPANTAPNRA